MHESESMRVVSQDRLGDAEVLQVAIAPKPRPGPSEIRVRVVSTSLNPTDFLHRAKPGSLGPLAGSPRVLGWDVAGIVDAVGTGVTIHSPGDRVFGMLPYPFGHGAAAEYVVSPARAMVAAPEGLSLDVLGAVPLAALTAWQVLVDTASLEAGQRVLIHAAAGGVGHFATQIAHARGAYVIGTASSPKHELLRELGADETIDYRTTDVGTAVSDVDAVIDTIGGDTAARSLPTLRPGGTIVSLSVSTTPPLGEVAEAAGIAHRIMLVEHDFQGMTEIARLLAAGRIRPVIAETFDLFDIDQLRAAHRLGETRRTTGKILLRA